MLFPQGMFPCPNDFRRGPRMACMAQKSENLKVIAVRCAAFAAVLRIYRATAARSPHQDVKKYYTNIADAGDRLILAMQEDDTQRMKLIILDFIRMRDGNNFTQPPEFRLLNEKFLEVRRLIQDQKAGPSNAPKRRR